MTVIVLRKSERFDKSGKMFFSETDNFSGADNQEQRWCEESQSRVSFPPEDGLSSESSLCWTMRTAAHSDHHYPQYRSQSNNRLSTQKSSNSSSNNLSSSSSISHSSSSHSSSLSFSSSDKMFDKSIQKSIGILSGSTIAKLFSSSTTGKSCSHSHYYPKLTSPSTESLLPSSKSQKSYHHHHHSWASFGMILIAVIILSTFSTSSMVMCVPLGGTGNGGVEEARRAAGGPGLMMGLTPSKMMELHRKLQQNSQQNQGEHLPSLNTQGDGGAVAEQTVEHSNLHFNSNNPSNYHLNKQQSPIQKLHHKDFTRSILENPGDELEDDDEDDSSKEMNNEVETMIAPQPISSSSSLMGLGRITLADAGVGGGDEESTGDLIDRSSAAAGGDESGQWETVIDPHLYVLTEWNSNPFQRRQQQQQQQQFSMFRQQRKRRNSGTGPSLSIVNPLDVLRQRLLLEIARRRMRQSHNQIIANEEILRKIGRR